MKLLTLNCHSWIEKKQMEKLQITAEAIKEKGYDVIALQEVNQSIQEAVTDRNLKKDNYAAVLIEELKKIGAGTYQLVWDHSHISYGKYEEGTALLTKHEILEKNSFFISKDTDSEKWKTRKITGAEILIEGIPISFYSCHLGWWDDQEEPFKDQAISLLNHMKKDSRFFLMGDFNNNAFIRGEGYDFLLEKGLYDTYSLAEVKDEGITVEGKIAGWSKNREKLRIDLILTNEKCRVLSSGVIFNGINKPVVSDHFGVEAVLNLSSL
ncbi:endonuclease/exonuclease/phosphatase family protein [Metabacillus sp. GX 13764]|uniref:endonuclease/exonuclease/phosphatase family protein n=1 Tax=Metabacillus kandeliae TaxID=2900151 RepID=UPI001E602545|nr:endonuclease/exonuclease/phosphatase family protein [Metabacillus kandeliae]MCD7034761.1 endonuclease/exonuclease/phosphatase family protein [Metabacillus kandeliae]